MVKPGNLTFLLCFCGTNIVYFSLIVSIVTSMYKFTSVPQHVVGQSIVLRDSLSFGQFDLLKSKISTRVDVGLSSDQSELYLSHGLVSRFQHKLHNDQREKWLETVIRFIILSRQKIRSRILQFLVGSETCWFRQVRLVKFNREPALGQFWFKLDQFMSVRLKSPRKIILGRGEGNDITYV